MAIKKYRPYLTYHELLMIHDTLIKSTNTSDFLLRNAEDKRNLMSAEYVISSLIRDIAYEKKSPDIIASNRIINASVNVNDMFTENEVSNITGKKDSQILANASEYEQELIFLNQELSLEFIGKERYEQKLTALKSKYSIT